MKLREVGVSREPFRDLKKPNRFHFEGTGGSGRVGGGPGQGGKLVAGIVSVFDGDVGRKGCGGKRRMCWKP